MAIKCHLKDAILTSSSTVTQLCTGFFSGPFWNVAKPKSKVNTISYYLLITGHHQ